MIPSRKRTRRETGLAIAGLVLLIGLSSLPATAESPVAAIVAKMPAQDPATGQPMLEQILRLGPAGLKELCSMVTPPQDTSDAGARYAVHGLVLHTKQRRAQAYRAMVEKALIDALAKAKDPDLKVFFIEQLQLCGSAACENALGGLLGDEKLYGPASRALTRLGSPHCVELIRGELPKAKGKRLVAFVQALGVLADKRSAKAILPHAKADDQALRRTAWYALANIGDASAVETLKAAAGSKDVYERTLGTKYYLLLARRLAENGAADTACDICRELLTTRTDPADGHVQCAALWVLTKAAGDAASDDLLAAMAGKNAYVRQAAMNILTKTGGEAMTAKIVERVKAAKGKAKADLVAVLGLRGDKAAAPVVLAAMSDADPAVAAAATKAAAAVAPDDILKLMTARMKLSDTAAVAAAKDALLRAQANGLEKALAAAMAGASPVGKTALLDVLAVRGTKGNSQVAFDALKDSDRAVRAAAAKALPTLAGPADLGRTIELLLSTDEPAVRSAAQGVVVGLSRGAGAKAVINALAKANAQSRPVLLQTLSRIGGRDALSATRKKLASSDAAVKDAAGRALADWQGPEALEAMADLAVTGDSKVHRVLATRGIARLVGQGEGVAPARAVAACAKALGAAGATEKNLLLGALGSVQTAEAVTLATKHLDDSTTREAAAVAIVKVACPARRYKGLRGPAVVEALTKVVAVSKNPRAVDQAKKHLANIRKGK